MTNQAIGESLANHADRASRGKKLRLRFSLLALLLFVTATCLALAWWVQPKRVAATALFQINRVEPALLGKKSYNEPEFAIFKKTQLAKLKSYSVLNSAVCKPGIAKSPVFQNHSDPTVWLQQNLVCEYPGDSEILAISLSGIEPHAKDLARIVDAVAKAYEDEVLTAEVQQRLSEGDLAAKTLKKLSEELADKSELLDEIRKDAGPNPPASVSIRIRELEIDNLWAMVRDLRRELLRCQLEANAPARIKQVQSAVVGPDR